MKRKNLIFGIDNLLIYISFIFSDIVFKRIYKEINLLMKNSFMIEYLLILILVKEFLVKKYQEINNAKLISLYEN